MPNGVDVRRVNRTCGYRSAVGDLLPAVMTAVGVGTNADLRVGRHGETYLTIPKFNRVTPTIAGWIFNGG